MSESESNSSSQDEIAKSFQYLPERQAKVATLLNMMKKTDKTEKHDKDKDKDTEDDSSDPIYYCICRSTDGTRFMICCDYCEEWYHGNCIGIEKEASRSIKRYACPPCQKKNPEAKTLYKEKKEKVEVRKEKEKEKEKERERERERERDKERHEREREQELHPKKKKKKKKKKVVSSDEKKRKERRKDKIKKKKKRMPTSSSSDRDSRKVTGAAARHARRCGQCQPCQLISDCGKCDFCLDMKKYGGLNKLRQKCRLKQCIRLASKVLRHKNLGSSQSESDTRNWDTASLDTDTDTQSSFSERPNRQSTPSSVDVSLLDHYDYAMRPELDPTEKKEKKERKEKKEKQSEHKEKQAFKEKEKRPTKEERKRKRAQQKPTIDEPKFKRVLRSAAPVEEDLPQCYGPGCVNAARHSSKYCSEACGLKLATNRLFEFLPQRIQQWQRSPCIAEENNKKSLEKMRSEMEEAKKKIGELDGKIVKLNNLIDRAKREKVALDQDNTDGESEEADLSIFCVSCGHPINPARALRHMSKCYTKYESQTSFGSAFKTKIVGESMFCDFFNSQQNTYCKRLKVLCPEHTKEPKVSADEVCGCPLVADVFQETKGFCRIAKRKCSKHYNWEKLRRAEIDLERVRWWLKLDELLEQERNIRQAMFNRAGVLGLMLHQTLDHSLLMPTGVPPQHQAQVAVSRQ
ncbi:CXXC-type zinc finger protein 1-like isoform X2 [Asterias rubens]|uniref:CXXC-type zinc finger protein 1-like isoform X2 n=1 Tax=Asterias rubens TaxID=7604 RepID=UPI001455769D|nr:CXXC-type zinc finger protein 1-like isoform X2 [Asterias rubens]